MADRNQVAQAIMSNYTPSWREKIGNSIYDVARALMPSTANRMREEAMMAVDFIPGVGDAVGLNDAYNDFNAGNYGLAAAGLGLTAAGAIPGVGDAAANAGRKGIRAFHGSPHDFDKFSMDKIGTGEGAQAYGHGLYFAESEDVARSYREQLADGFSIDGKPFNASTTKGGSAEIGNYAADALSRFKGDKEAAIEWLSEKDAGPASHAAAKMLRKAKSIEPWSGSMYEVNINADPDDFLDWDAPLSEQPSLPRVGGAFGGAGDGAPSNLADMIEAMARDAVASDDPQVRNAGKNAILSLRGGEVRGEGAVRMLERLSGKDTATAALREAGIPGIKYLDQGSRGAGDGSRNFVVFDDALIEIVKKYGLAGAVAAGLISQEMAAQMQAQGIEEL